MNKTERNPQSSPQPAQPGESGIVFESSIADEQGPVPLWIGIRSLHFEDTQPCAPQDRAEELAVAQQLIDQARERNLHITLADLGVLEAVELADSGGDDTPAD